MNPLLRIVHNPLQWLLMLLCLLMIGTGSFAQADNKLTDGNIYLADPTIFYHGGVYYLYGTVDKDAGKGFLVYSSKDLKTWGGPTGVNDGFALKKGDAFGSQGFWAPQVFYYNKKFYMAYVADEKIAVAESDSPLGPFVQTDKKALDAPVKQIDPFIFIDDDGKKYLYHVRLDKGNKLYVAELNDDFQSIKEGTLKECITATEHWENIDNAPWTVTEGPSIIKHNKLYYFVYTANDFRSPNYAVGYAVSSSPYGPWKKSADNPIINKLIVGKNGPGHGDFFTDAKGKLHYVFHTHNSSTKATPRITAIVDAGFMPDGTGVSDKLIINAKSFYYLQLINKQ
jgi:xylan 1,4-beta-xylosidase